MALGFATEPFVQRGLSSRYNQDMSVQEIQTAIVELPLGELENLLEWIEEYRSDAWDRQIAQDVEAGRFDALRQRVQEQRQAGECQPFPV